MRLPGGGAYHAGGETWVSASRSSPLNMVGTLEKKNQIKPSNETSSHHQEERERETEREREVGTWRNLDPPLIMTKAIGWIFCPSCCGSQEQLQRHGSIHASVSLLRCSSRSIINDTENQGEILPRPVGWHMDWPREVWTEGRYQKSRGERTSGHLQWRVRIKVPITVWTGAQLPAQCGQIDG